MTAISLLFLLLAQDHPAKGKGPYDTPPPTLPQVKMTVSATPSSPWAIEADVKNNKLTILNQQQQGIALDVDCDDHRRDQRYEGITLIVGGKRLEGRFHGSTVSFLSVDHDAGPVFACSAQALDNEVRVRFENGSLRRLSPAAPDEPLFFEAVFRIDKDRKLAAYLNGLYYLFPRLEGSVVKLPGQPDKKFSKTSKKSIEYFEHVTAFDVIDPMFGTFSFSGLVERLQIQVHEAPNTDLFELDFDHTFKDRGQRAVSATLKWKDPLPEK